MYVESAGKNLYGTTAAGNGKEVRHIFRLTQQTLIICIGWICLFFLFAMANKSIPEFLLR